MVFNIHGVIIMLKKFSVENFKNFNTRITLDLSQPGNFEFNNEVIRNGIISKGLVYGPNGSGKSNLGIAIFDIILHMTDKQKELERYNPYLCLNSNNDVAKFEYVFQFNDVEVNYQYSKTGPNSLVEERLQIDNQEVLFYDFRIGRGKVRLAGAENLNLSSGDSPISRVKFVKNNAILSNDPITETFNSFVNFVDNMLLFYSLDSRGYQGFEVGISKVGENIILNHHTQDFSNFLSEQGLNYNLIEREVNGTQQLYCQFNNKEINFYSIASTGTISLSLFYYWFTKLSSVSFAFIDEFDAFYHFELAASIVKMVRSFKDTQIFLTTHNTDLMSNDLLRPDCYFLIGENHIKTITQLTDKELRKAHNLQKMYKAGAFHE